MRRDHGLKDGQMFKDWREVAALDKKLADIAMICVQVKSGHVKMKIVHLCGVRLIKALSKANY